MTVINKILFHFMIDDDNIEHTNNKKWQYILELLEEDSLN